jgi:hypothetical protein
MTLGSMKTYWIFKKHSNHSIRNDKSFLENQYVIIDEMNGSHRINEENSSHSRINTNKLDNSSAKRKKSCQLL